MKHHLPSYLHFGGVLALAILYQEAAHQSDAKPPGPPPAPTATTVALTTTGAPADPSAPMPPAAATDSAAASPATRLSDSLTRALRSGSAKDRDHALLVLLPRLIAEDPATAGHLALAWEPGPLRDEFLRQVIHHWSAADIGGVLTWLTSLLDTNDRALAATASTAQVRQADPAGALDLSQLLRVGLEDGSFEHLAQLWTEDDPRAAVDWVMTQPAGMLRDRLLARIAWVRAQSDPAEAADLVLTRMNPGETQNSAVGAVVRQWALRAPDEAAEWVGHFPSGPLRTHALTELETARRMSGER